MKNIFSNIAILFALILTLASCRVRESKFNYGDVKETTEEVSKELHLVQFSLEIFRNPKHKLTLENLKKIQFYNNDEIILEKDAGGVNTEIAKGSLIVYNGKMIYRVTVPEETGGGVIKMGADSLLYVSFEDEDKYSLVFGPDQAGKYVLLWMGKEPKIIDYGGERYELQLSDKAARPGLYFDFQNLEDLKEKEKIVKGRKVTDSPTSTSSKNKSKK